MRKYSRPERMLSDDLSRQKHSMIQNRQKQTITCKNIQISSHTMTSNIGSSKITATWGIYSESGNDNTSEQRRFVHHWRRCSIVFISLSPIISFTKSSRTMITSTRVSWSQSLFCKGNTRNNSMPALPSGDTTWNTAIATLWNTRSTILTTIATRSGLVSSARGNSTLMKSLGTRSTISRPQSLWPSRMNGPESNR